MYHAVVKSLNSLSTPQVVYLVGSNNQRPPLSYDTPLNGLIEECWQTNPDERPSFEEVYERLKQLQTADKKQL